MMLVLVMSGTKAWRSPSLFLGQRLLRFPLSFRTHDLLLKQIYRILATPSSSQVQNLRLN